MESGALRWLPRNGRCLEVEEVGLPSLSLGLLSGGRLDGEAKLVGGPLAVDGDVIALVLSGVGSGLGLALELLELVERARSLRVRVRRASTAREQLVRLRKSKDGDKVNSTLSDGKVEGKWGTYDADGEEVLSSSSVLDDALLCQLGRARRREQRGGEHSLDEADSRGRKWTGQFTRRHAKVESVRVMFKLT